MTTTTKLLRALSAGMCTFGVLVFAACSTSAPPTPAPDNHCPNGGKCETLADSADRECREHGTKVFKSCLDDSPVEDVHNADSDDPEVLEEREFCTEERQKAVADCRDGRAVEHCEARRRDSLDSSTLSFVPHAIRWACADVKGVNIVGGDSRGQEYCEYFAAVQLPPVEEGEDLPDPVTTGRVYLEPNGRLQNKPLDIQLSDYQIEQLDENSHAVVGKCVFTSWHTDIERPYPTCVDGIHGPECGRLPLLPGANDSRGRERPSYAASALADAVASLPLVSQVFQMKVGFNSNLAAIDLVDKCLIPEIQTGEDHFLRACQQTYELYQTEWRRSDPSVCAAAYRLAECGCGVDVNQDGDFDDEGEIGPGEMVELASLPEFAHLEEELGGEKVHALAVALVPRAKRGFQLGTWSPDPDALPAGCEHIDIGEDGHYLVSCDITGLDVIAGQNQTDLKNVCRTKYARDVVVHVPVPDAVVTCNPPGDGPNSTNASCGQRPWVIGNEGIRAPAPVEPTTESDDGTADDSSDEVTSGGRGRDGRARGGTRE